MVAVNSFAGPIPQITPQVRELDGYRRTKRFSEVIFGKHARAMLDYSKHDWFLGDPSCKRVHRHVHLSHPRWDPSKKAWASRYRGQVDARGVRTDIVSEFSPSHFKDADLRQVRDTLQRGYTSSTFWIDTMLFKMYTNCWKSLEIPWRLASDWHWFLSEYFPECPLDGPTAFA